MLNNLPISLNQWMIRIVELSFNHNPIIHNNNKNKEVVADRIQFIKYNKKFYNNWHLIKKIFVYFCLKKKKFVHPEYHKENILFH
jgi:hypothetical protein